MLFNSYEFIFLFLPLCLLLFFTIAKSNLHGAILFLVIASLGFYAWWEPSYLLLILSSMIGNFTLGRLVENTRKKSKLYAKLILIIGITANLLLLGYYKYFNFVVKQIDWLTGNDYGVAQILLPLAISFFTFQQIAYLVDTFRQEIQQHNFIQYCLFVSFFPQLIAGPIVHHKEMLPQFSLPETFRSNQLHIAVGLTLFSIGLFKKVVLADGIGVYATPLFNAVDHQGATLTGFEAWLAALSYSLQLYFDFSGYSDMALGLARLFGIRLPANFDSPYKATSIIEFWRCWHMTLSRFLRDYLYITLGGSRKGNIRRYINVFLTMLLGGLWHGAGWNFIIWGALHGSYLVINHLWRDSRRKIFSNKVSRLESTLYWFLTILAVIVGWVYFRAETLEGANSILLSMTDYASFLILSSYHVHAFWGAVWCMMLIPIATLFPNSLQISQRVESQLEGRPVKPYLGAGLYTLAAFGGVAAMIAIGQMAHISEFLYFNF